MEVEKTATCKDCLHFIQHYTLYSDGLYHDVNCGHCIAARIRRCYPHDNACDRWYAPKDR